MTTTVLATPDDVVDLRPSASSMDQRRLARLIDKASVKLRAKCPFDIDARMTLDPSDPLYLDPVRVADRIAIIVKRFLVNEDGVASSSEGMGSFSQSRTFVNRYDKTGSDVRGEITIIDEDIEDLRPASAGFVAPTSVAVHIPDPSVYIPAGGRYAGVRAGLLPVITPDVNDYDSVGQITETGQ